MSAATPFFSDVQAHYDLNDEFFALFLDESWTYTCAYFERKDMTLAKSQMAKLDLSVNKLNLRPGMTLLDVGCGWGSAMFRALDHFGVNVVGLTLSQNQCSYLHERLGRRGADETVGEVHALINAAQTQPRP